MMKKPMGRSQKMTPPTAPAPKGGKLKAAIMKAKLEKALGGKK